MRTTFDAIVAPDTLRFLVARRLRGVFPILAALLTLFATNSQSRADEALIFEVHAVADRPGPHAREYLGLIKGNDGKPESTLLVDPPLLDSKSIRFVSVNYTEDQKPFILINLTDTGAKKFEQITKDMIGRQIGFVIGGQLYSLPRVSQASQGGKIAISGDFTAREAGNLAERLNAALPSRAAGH